MGQCETNVKFESEFRGGVFLIKGGEIKNVREHYTRLARAGNPNLSITARVF